MHYFECFVITSSISHHVHHWHLASEVFVLVAAAVVVLLVVLSSIFYFIIFTFTHMCIHCLPPLPPTPPLPGRTCSALMISDFVEEKT
jgi:hypothetical protein